MNQESIKIENTCYQLAEQKAAHYYHSLNAQYSQKTYVNVLTKDVQLWKSSHIHPRLFLSFFLRKKEKPNSKGFHHYIQWLNRTGKLTNYLERSISYIYMRDLGKSLDSPYIQKRILRAVDSIKTYLEKSAAADREGKISVISIAGLYREAQKAGIESTLLWALNKLKNVSSHIPKGMDAVQAQRKLIKLIAGVMMHALEEMDDKISPVERAKRLDKAIRLGYSYGLTYPFIDDLLDAKVLSAKEKKQYSDLIRTALLTGAVPELGEWTGNNNDLIRFIHSELGEAFEYIQCHLQPETRSHFFEQCYVFFNSQELDRNKDLFNANYSNEELYLPVILKSSFSRLIARSIISAPEDEGYESRTFFYGIYNQLADDFTDMFDDLKEGSVTPYTYYLKYHDQRPDLINPFELYWTVISNLIHNVYKSDSKTIEVILDRAINGLKRFKARMGLKKYNEVMDLFASGNPKFNKFIQKMVSDADDVDFFDKLLRDHIITILKNNRKEQEDFFQTIETVRNQINNTLHIQEMEQDSLIKEPIVEAANYSLKGDGKRLRPIMTWVMGVNEYEMNESAIVPLLKSLEYMHSASLIFDDLPSQDNSSTRRGRLTLHQKYNIAIAELTGLFLTQKAVEEQASLDGFDAKTVLNLIQYSSKIVQIMCKGQAMDLDSKGKQLTLGQLNRMCFYKTGIAFEASLIMPAILAHAPDSEMDGLKKFSYHAGIAFQIKDDLLDVEGDAALLGKPIGKDAENNNSTFVSILGEEGAKKEMWEHYCLAMEALQSVPQKTTFLQHLLSYIVNRDH